MSPPTPLFRRGQNVITSSIKPQRWFNPSPKLTLCSSKGHFVTVIFLCGHLIADSLAQTDLQLGLISGHSRLGNGLLFINSWKGQPIPLADIRSLENLKLVTYSCFHWGQSSSRHNFDKIESIKILFYHDTHQIESHLVLCGCYQLESTKGTGFW